MKTASGMAPFLRALLSALVAMIVCWTATCQHPRAGNEEGAPAETTFRCRLRKAPLMSWFMQGRIVSRSPKSFIDCVTLPEDNPCGFTTDWWSRWPGTWRKEEIADRDKKLARIQAIVSQAPLTTQIEIIVVDGFFYSPPGAVMDYDHAIVFACDPRAHALRSQLANEGGSYASPQEIAKLRPPVATLVSGVRAISIGRFDSKDCVLVTYFDGKHWYSRPWFYVSDNIDDNDEGHGDRGPYKTFRSLMSPMLDDMGIKLGHDGRWSSEPIVPLDR